MRRALLGWYRARRGAYPWRRRPTPYRVLVSEVMLQQTQASRVAPAFEAFLRDFPTLRALAAAPRADVVRAWSGLGFNRRAVALHEAARRMVRDHAGRVPRDRSALEALPGIGPYTASAVAALAFGAPVPAVDVNVRRVVARVRLGRDPQEVPAREVHAAAEAWIDPADPGEWNQALMDLGRDLCRPTPRCASCPLARGCHFRRADRSPGPRAGSQARFEGSFRALRGGVLRAVLIQEGGSLGSLASETGEPLHRVAAAVRSLQRDGLVHAGPSAVAGKPAGRVGLPG